MRIRVREKVFKRACRKIEQGENLSSLELRVYMKICRETIQRLPRAAKRMQEAILNTLERIVKTVENIQEMIERERDFAKRLEDETPMSYEESVQLIGFIMIFGNIEKAKEIYESDGFYALKAYQSILEW